MLILGKVLGKNILEFLLLTYLPILSKVLALSTNLSFFIISLFIY